MSPVEQALLAEKCMPENRNRVFGVNAFVGSIMGSLGALLSGLPEHLQENWGWAPIASYKPLFGLTILFSIVLIFAYSSIDEHHVHVARKEGKRSPTKRVGGFVIKMSLLGMIDNLGGGLISPLMSYWFFLRYGVELKSLGIKGPLIKAAELGYITEVTCGMPKCFCPEELGGAGYFAPRTNQWNDWEATFEHYPIPKVDGGRRTIDNAVLAHRLCNKLDHSIRNGLSI